MSWMTRSLVFTTLLGLAGAGFAADPAKKAAKGKEKPVRGTVVSVEGKNLKIKPIAARKSAGEAAPATATPPAEQVLAVNDKTVVTIEGKEGKLADLKAGQRVVVTTASGSVKEVAAKAAPARKRAEKKPGKVKA